MKEAGRSRKTEPIDPRQEGPKAVDKQLGESGLIFAKEFASLEHVPTILLLEGVRHGLIQIDYEAAKRLADQYKNTSSTSTGDSEKSSALIKRVQANVKKDNKRSATWQASHKDQKKKYKREYMRKYMRNRRSGQ